MTKPVGEPDALIGHVRFDVVNALKPVTLPPGRASPAITPLVSGPRPLSFRQIRRSPEGVGTVPVGTCCSLN